MVREAMAGGNMTREMTKEKVRQIQIDAAEQHVIDMNSGLSVARCVFRGKLDTHSTANRSPIPRQTGHPVQRKLDSNSAPN